MVISNWCKNCLVKSGQSEKLISDALSFMNIIIECLSVNLNKPDLIDYNMKYLYYLDAGNLAQQWGNWPVLPVLQKFLFKIINVFRQPLSRARFVEDTIVP